MDISTPVGIVFGIAALLFGFAHEGGSIGSLGGLAAFIIVFGGTFGAVMASFPFANLKNIIKWLQISFTSKAIDLNEYSELLLRFAEKARREGLLSLQQDLETIDDPFTYQGMQLIIDGTDPETTQEILSSSIDVMSQRHKVGISVFEAAGGYAPTLGIIGTVMGLIQVLGNLTDAAALSRSIASAFTATLYGVASANLIFLPIATKLKFKDGQEVARMEMVLEGILSIQVGENLFTLKEKLRAHLGSAANEAQSEGFDTASSQG